MARSAAGSHGAGAAGFAAGVLAEGRDVALEDALEDALAVLLAGVLTEVDARDVPELDDSPEEAVAEPLGVEPDVGPLESAVEVGLWLGL